MTMERADTVPGGGEDIARRYQAGERDFSGARLAHADLASVTLRGADLTGADLGGAYLFDSDLEGANLQNAVLCFANLVTANLRNATLKRADLQFAQLAGTDLSGADLQGAILGGTAFLDNDFTLMNLADITHEGPSSIGHEALESSARGLRARPEKTAEVVAFLTGCGVAPQWLKLFKTLSGLKETRSFDYSLVRRSTLSSWTKEVGNNLDKIHQLIRVGRSDEAARVYSQCLNHRTTPQYLQEAIEEEARFLRVVDESKRFGTSNSRFGLTPRQALIYAALVGWKGDDASGWSSPTEEETLIAWAQSHYGGPEDHLDAALKALEEEYLFVEVHPGVFEQSCYFCTFESDFLSELPDGDEYRELWTELRRHYANYRGWTSTGLCHGQGSQGPSDAPFGICLGSGCVWFREGELSCNFDLSFNSDLVPIRRAMLQTTFLSYGSPDEAFAEKLDRALRKRGVKTWFFKRDAEPGAKLHVVMRDGVNQYDRIVLICSQNSLERPGVLNEIEQALARESREGGKSIIIPITIDDYVFNAWNPDDKARRQELLDRVVADFRGTEKSYDRFKKAVDRLVRALKA